MESFDIDNIDINDESIWNIIDSLDESIDSKETNSESEEKKSECCKGCGSINFDSDNVNGILVCMDCGMVDKELLDRNPDWNSYNDGKNNIGRCGCPTNFFLPQSSLGTKVNLSCGRYSRIAMLEKWNQMPYKERSLNDVLQYITTVCKKKMEYLEQ